MVHAIESWRPAEDTTRRTRLNSGCGHGPLRKHEDRAEVDLDQLYAAVKAERGSLDIVFANAGVGSHPKRIS